MTGCVCSFLVASAAAESKVRMVRLSDVEGTVRIERVAGEGLEKAFLNLPVVEGARVMTGKDGRAEIELEDASTIRLGPDTEIDFTHLALGDDGEKLNAVELVSGTFYANVRERKGDQFEVNFVKSSITVPDTAHFRLVLSPSKGATVAVFKGSVRASGPSGVEEVAQKHSATINLATNSQTGNPAKDGAFIVAKNYDEDLLDGWDRQQNDYHDRYATSSGSSFSSPYGYGVSDLNYYGSFNMIPGYGFGWQPFFADASWNPFMDGAWAYYPGAGYTWVSAYPWGWMPYYYGNWGFAQGYGWYWQPGTWNSWSSFPHFNNPALSAKVPTPPMTGHQTVMVGHGLTSNPAALPSKLTIHPGSASLGVPRGAVSHLDRRARTMERTSRPVSVATVSPPESPSVFTTSPGMMGSAGRMSPMTGMGPSPSRGVAAGPHR